MSAAQQTAAEKALKDRDRQFSRYRAAKRAEFERLYAMPIWGERLQEFNKAIRKTTPDDVYYLIRYIEASARGWLLDAPKEFQQAALELVGNRIIRIRERAGLDPFNDPLPDQDDDVFIICKRTLG